MDTPTTEFVVSLLGPRPRAPAGVDWNETVRLLRLHRLVGLAFEAHERHGRLLPESVARELTPDRRRQALQGTVALELVERVRAALGRAGVPVLVYKGARLLEAGAYGCPAARVMDDVDVLVPLDRADDAWRALRADGFVPWRAWDPARTPRWLDAAAFRAPDLPPGVPRDVDLHWRVGYDRVRFGGAGADHAIWAGAVDGGPAPGAHWVILAEHLIKHLRYQVHLVAYADLGVVAARVRDWDAVTRRMARSELRRGLRALGAVCAELGHPVPDAWAGREPGIAKRLDPRPLVGRTALDRGRIGGLLWRWRILGGARAVWTDVRRGVLPDRGWLEARYGDEGTSVAGLWGHYLRDVWAWARGRRNAPTSPDLHGPRPEPRGRGRS